MSLYHGKGLTAQRIHKAVSAQMEQVAYCHSLFYATDAAEELATLLIERSHGEMARAFIVSSGSEAIEAALKLVSKVSRTRGIRLCIHVVFGRSRCLLEAVSDLFYDRR